MQFNSRELHDVRAWKLNELSTKVASRFFSFKRDFGAIGAGADSTAIDTIAWSLAMAALTKGGTLYIEEGEYHITTGASIVRAESTALVAAPGIHIVGQNRRSTRLKFTATSGYLLSVAGTCIDSAGTGLVEDFLLSNLTIEGAGDGFSGSNTESGVYLQGFQFCQVTNVLFEKFGRDGFHADRKYYSQSPNPTLDDRSVCLELDKVQARFCGRYGMQFGDATNTSEDYSIDHVITRQCYTSSCGSAGIYAYVQNWTDITSVLQGRTKGTVLRQSSNVNFPNHSVLFLNTRWEETASDCNIEILQGQNIVFSCCGFVTNQTSGNPPVAVKVGTSGTGNVYYVLIQNCRWSNSTTAVQIGSRMTAQGIVRIEDPMFLGVTTEVSNSSNRPCVIVNSNNWQRVTGGGPVINVTGVDAVNALTATQDGDAHPFFQIDTLNRKLSLGSGSATPDAAILRGLMGDGTTAAVQFEDPLRLPGAVTVSTGSGTPESVVSAAVGSFYLRTDGANNTTLYVKEAGGTGSSGWVPFFGKNLYNSGDTYPYVQFADGAHKIILGNGSSTADASFLRGTMADGTTPAVSFEDPIRLPNGVTVSSGSNSPEGVLTANVGSLFLRTNGSSDTTLYIKESGSGNTGWASTGISVPISTGSGTPEGVVTASRGALFLRDDGANNTTLYVKEAGTGNTGWVPMIGKNIYNSGDTYPYIQFADAARKLIFGNGSATGDVSMLRSTMADGTTPALLIEDPIRLTGAVTISTGSGTPEGVVTANRGALYLRLDGGAGTCLYVKETGTGNTGWVGK